MDNFNSELVLPELTLDPTPVAPSAPIVQESAEDKALPEEKVLSPEQLKAAADFAKKIDVTNANMVLLYGSEAQKKISSFSETALNNVRTKDMGEVGSMLTNLVSELKNFKADEPEAKGLSRFFKKSTNSLSAFKTRYDSVEKNVDKICDVLEGHKIQLLKDIALLDQMYDMNLAYYKELTMYIYAGKQKLAQVRDNELAELIRKAQQSNAPDEAQAAKDLDGMCNRFEKKIHDLELTRMISIQMGPQIRLIQNNDSMMVEKIQSSITNTIPLWKNQMVLALGIHHSREAMLAQRGVTDMTNELLRKNADTLKMATIETAKESERGIVDIETLQHTNQSLISTLDEVMTIQREGRQKRQQAEVELRRIEGELKNKLLELSDKR